MVPQGSILVSFVIVGKAIAENSLSHKKGAGVHMVKTVLKNLNHLKLNPILQSMQPGKILDQMPKCQ